MVKCKMSNVKCKMSNVKFEYVYGRFQNNGMGVVDGDDGFLWIYMYYILYLPRT